jgi:hypothetical protein
LRLADFSLLFCSKDHKRLTVLHTKPVAVTVRLEFAVEALLGRGSMGSFSSCRIRMTALRKPVSVIGSAEENRAATVDLASDILLNSDLLRVLGD